MVLTSEENERREKKKKKREESTYVRALKGIRKDQQDLFQGVVWGQIGILTQDLFKKEKEKEKNTKKKRKKVRASFSPEKSEPEDRPYPRHNLQQGVRKYRFAEKEHI